MPRIVGQIQNGTQLKKRISVWFLVTVLPPLLVIASSGQVDLGFRIQAILGTILVVSLLGMGIYALSKLRKKRQANKRIIIEDSKVIFENCVLMPRFVDLIPKHQPKVVCDVPSDIIEFKSVGGHYEITTTYGKVYLTSEWSNYEAISEFFANACFTTTQDARDEYVDRYIALRLIIMFGFILVFVGFTAYIISLR